MSGWFFKERHICINRHITQILKVARTIADLEACADVLDHHIMEAIAYRNFDRPTYLGNS